MIRDRGLSLHALNMFQSWSPPPLTPPPLYCPVVITPRVLQVVNLTFRLLVTLKLLERRVERSSIRITRTRSSPRSTTRFRRNRRSMRMSFPVTAPRLTQMRRFNGTFQRPRLFKTRGTPSWKTSLLHSTNQLRFNCRTLLKRELRR